MHNSQTQHFQLDTPQHCPALHVAAGDMVQITQGSIWLTLEGHSRDVWLTAPACWTVPLDAKLWISADAAAAFSLSRPAIPVVASRPVRAKGRVPLAAAA
jgi:hypothetical protein